MKEIIMSCTFGWSNTSYRDALVLLKCSLLIKIILLLV